THPLSLHDALPIWRDFGIEARLIAICIRHLGPDRALALAQQMVAEPHPYVVALGMGGDEAKFSSADFAPAYRLAHDKGYGCTIHAGEVLGPESVRAAIRDLPVTRIGHGVRSIEDPALVDELARRGRALGAVILTAVTGGARAQDPAPSDMLLATLWTQTSVEFKGNALTVYALGRLRLDQALADKAWTAAPAEQKGDFANLPPAVVLDV